MKSVTRNGSPGFAIISDAMITMSIMVTSPRGPRSISGRRNSVKRALAGLKSGRFIIILAASPRIGSDGATLLIQSNELLTWRHTRR
jgi:hypothetical protein